MEKCGNCRYSKYRFSYSGRNEKLNCHRFPPTIHNTEDAFSQFPVVNSGNWCGEWKEKLNECKDDC